MEVVYGEFWEGERKKGRRDEKVLTNFLVFI
jgi:hypothetical protein